MKSKRTCIGTGLVSLDMLMGGGEDRQACRVGGTCGNVLMILAHLGWDTWPMARLDRSDWSDKILQNMRQFGVHTDFVTTEDSGRTPVIIQHNSFDPSGNPIHRFSFLNRNGRHFLDFSAVTKAQAKVFAESLAFTPDVFFFDRVSPAAIYLAEYFRDRGSLVYFEPSVKKLDEQFCRCVQLSHIVKFSEQRMPDVSFVDNFSDKLFIQTLGSRGLRYNLRSAGWESVNPVPNVNSVDTSGAGDWTTAVFLATLPSKTFDRLTPQEIYSSLVAAQQTASRSCSYNGARGMMESYD